MNFECLDPGLSHPQPGLGDVISGFPGGQTRWPGLILSVALAFAKALPPLPALLVEGSPVHIPL
jgi:hypothetical protein